MPSPNLSLAVLPIEDWQHGGFGLYVHWPFCQAKCPYCDFNSHVTTKVDHDVWATGLVQELVRGARETDGRLLNSIYFGGGTPSLMAPSTVAAIIDAAQRHWSFANDIEITLEANPTSVEAKKFQAFRDAGVNRISLGVQALDDADLRLLGRRHNAQQALDALAVARSVFERTSFDLIYARQNQSLDDWTAELRRALSFEPDHLSLYQLTIEPGTAFGDRLQHGGLRGLPNEDLAVDLYEATEMLCAEYHLESYEVSNYAKPGAESQHNLIYWRGGDYLGIGPGAHGRVTLNGTRYATECARAPSAWLDRMQRLGTAETVRNSLSKRERAEEYAMMSLRLSEGMDTSRFEALNGEPIPRQVIEDAMRNDLLTESRERLIATSSGRMVLNSLLVELLR